MQDFETQISDIKKQIDSGEVDQEMVAEVLRKSGIDVGALGIDLDMENAKLEDVMTQQETMNGNIAGLIVDLDNVTSAFGDQFKEMKEKTKFESLVGWFAKDKSDAMSQERIRTTDISGNLNELIRKSDTITEILQGQLGVLIIRFNKSKASLEQVLEDRVVTVGELTDVREKISALDPQMIQLENDVASEADPKTRTEKQKDLQALNEQHNELVNEEQRLIALSQTYEKYVEMYTTFVDSLENQRSTQMVLISKLETDTKQRVVLYDALSKSLVTASQQDVAHRINDIGSAVDNEAQRTMAHIGAATQQRMADMLEAHEGNMVFAQKIQDEKRKADDRFSRRFGEIMDKHDSGHYGGTAA